MSITRHTARSASAIGLLVTALVATPVAASAADLPPALVVPGFENVVIAERPLSGPAMPVSASPVRPVAAKPVAKTDVVKKRGAKKTTIAKAKRTKKASTARHAI